MKTRADITTIESRKADAGKVTTVLVFQPEAPLPAIANTTSTSANGWPDGVAHYSIDALVADIHYRADALTTVLAELLAQAEPVPHWGINE